MYVTWRLIITFLEISDSSDNMPRSTFYLSMETILTIGCVRCDTWFHILYKDETQWLSFLTITIEIIGYINCETSNISVINLLLLKDSHTPNRTICIKLSGVKHV